MRLQTFAAACAVALFIAGAPAARADLPTAHADHVQAGLLIHVNKSTQHMTVYGDGKPLYTWPVSTGGPGYNSPTGEFMPFRLSKHHVSHEYHDAPMPYAIFFHKGEAIHGTDEARYLGNAVSHGCVRLSVKHAAILWGLLKKYGRVHTEVVLTGNIPGATAAVAGAQNGLSAQDEQSAQNEQDDAGAGQPYRIGQPYYEENARSAYYGPPPRYRDDGPRFYADNEPPPPPPRYAERDSGPPPFFPFSLLFPGR